MQLGRFDKRVGLRGMVSIGAVTGVANAISSMNNGDYLGGALDFISAAVGAYKTFAPCFAVGTPILGEFGSKPIEEIRVGERVCARSEFDSAGPVELKIVEQTFVRLGRILNLHVGGQVIKTTSEHPFFVQHKGWIQAASIEIEDLLTSHNGQWVAVEDLLDTGEYETVYNLRVADFHTYFVGGQSWGFSVWRIMRVMQIVPAVRLQTMAMQFTTKRPARSSSSVLVLAR